MLLTGYLAGYLAGKEAGRRAGEIDALKWCAKLECDSCRCSDELPSWDEKNKQYQHGIYFCRSGVIQRKISQLINGPDGAGKGTNWRG